MLTAFGTDRLRLIAVQKTVSVLLDGKIAAIEDLKGRRNLLLIIELRSSSELEVSRVAEVADRDAVDCISELVVLAGVAGLDSDLLALPMNGVAEPGIRAHFDQLVRERDRP